MALADMSSLLVPRSRMPQIKRRHVRQFLAWLDRQGIRWTEGAFPARALKDTQAEVDADDVREIIARSAADASYARKKLGSRLLVSSDMYVLDGHHRWMARLWTAPDSLVPVVQVHLPIHELVPLAARFPLVQFEGMDDAAAARRTVRIRVGRRVVVAEVVSELDDVRKGLSGRVALAPGQGMLFAFQEPGLHRFWMAGTPFPLAALFLTPDGTVTDVAWMEPFTLGTHGPSVPVRLVLEVAQELARSEGVVPGDRVTVLGPVR